jgi:hypothetical protein
VEFVKVTAAAIPPAIPPPIKIKSMKPIIIQAPLEQPQQHCVFQHVRYYSSCLLISNDVVSFYFSTE